MHGPSLPPDLEEMLIEHDDPEDFVPFFASDIARCHGFHPRTVCRWIQAGKLRAHRLGEPRSRWRVLPIDYARAIWAAAFRDDRRMINLLTRGWGSWSE